MASDKRPDLVRSSKDVLLRLNYPTQNLTCAYDGTEDMVSNMASDAKVSFSSKVEYRAVIWYLYLKGKTGQKIYCELTNVYGSSVLSFLLSLHVSKTLLGAFNGL